MSRTPDTNAQRYLEPLLSDRLAWKYRIATVLWVGAAVFFWEWWLRPEHLITQTRFWIVTGPLIWVYLLQVYFLTVFLKARRSAAPTPREGLRVAMIVTKTPAEPFAVIERTLLAMLAQDYPHDTWLADEDPTPQTIEWCDRHGVRISTRKGRADYHRPVWPRRTRCKEGNLAFFYDHWGYDDYDIVCQLDADHVPQPGYLEEMLRPFADPGVGYVSAPSICSANSANSWAARSRMDIEAAFHGAFQSGYTGLLAPICIGSHYAVRTAALREIGGLGPELAEDHSTSLLMNAGGWRGVHAIDAIAYGDGPATISDLVTQEFQWSRSLLTILLTYTPRYLSRLPARLKFQFVFCQLWYPLFALTAAVMYFLPMSALVFNIRFADVTYPAFLGHILPTTVVLTSFAYQIRKDGFFRPRDARVISWEKALFICLQWPWVFWGCTMALRDRITGRFVDFRITPKGETARSRLPAKVLGVYVLLAIGCALPVLLSGNVSEARGFYLLSAFNAVIYTAIVIVIVFHHLRESKADWRQHKADIMVQLGSAGVVGVLVVVALILRAPESIHALTFGLEPFHLTRAEYMVSGAGAGSAGRIHFRFDPGWN